MKDVEKFLNNKREEIAERCRPKFIAAVKNGREKQYYEEIKAAAKLNPLYDMFLREVESWIK